MLIKPSKTNIIVRESLLEFERGRAVSDVLELGKMKKIREWLTKTVFNSQIKFNQDYSVDIKGDFIVTEKYDFDIPDYIQINIVDGDFICEDCHLKSLIGGPKIVKGGFYVKSNDIENLNGSPIIVEHDYNIRDNKRSFTIDEIRKVCEVGGKIFV